MTVREITREDIAEIARLEAECFPDFWTVGQLSGTFSRMDFCGVIAEEDGIATGYLIGSSLFESAEIARLAVSESFRKRGIGKALVGGFSRLVKSRGAEKILLEVRASNMPAQTLYLGVGFTPFKVRKGYYVNGEDALEMIKTL